MVDPADSEIPARWSRPMDWSSDGSCLGMTLQEPIEEGYKADYPTDNGCIHPDYCQALHNLL